MAIKSWCLLGLRIALAFVVINLGYMKLGPGHEGAVMMMGKFFPGSGNFWATLVGLIEFVGGFMILLGVFAPIAALLQAIVVVVAMLTVHRGGPINGYFLTMAVLGCCLAIIGAGAGKYRIVKKQCICGKCKAGCMMCGTAGGNGGCCGDKMTDKTMCTCKGCCGGNCGCGMPNGACSCCKK